MVCIKMIMLKCSVLYVDIANIPILFSASKGKPIHSMINNNILDNYELINMLGIGSFKKMKSNIKTAEEKFLINSYFRKEYVELEENIKKQID